MSSLNYPAHPKDEPKARHDLFAPRLPSKPNELLRSDTNPVLVETQSDIFDKFRSPVSGGTDKLLAHIYSYSDGPADRALAKALHIIGYVRLQLVETFLHKATSMMQYCYLGVHRGDGDFARALTKPGQLPNSHNFSKLLQYLWESKTVALLRGDNQGRVGILTPLWPHERWCEGVKTIRVGERGSYVGQCYFAQLDQWQEWANEDFEKHPPSNAQITDNLDSVEMWRPDDDDDGHNDGPLWLPNEDSTSNVAESHVIEPIQAPSSSTEQRIDNQFHEDDTAAAADVFYSGLTRELDSRAESRLFHMRAFNGWTKAIQIAELNPFTKDALQSKKRKRASGGALLGPLRVLDLACGKGGDLGKWILHSRGIENYVGIDVARGSLRDAAKRAQTLGLGKLKRCSFVCADLGSDVPGSKNKRNKLLTWNLTPLTALEDIPHFEHVQGGGVLPGEKFDVVSIQFAIHYMMSTKSRARRFFKTVADLLDIGGNLVATTIDARVVVEHIMNLGLDLFSLKEDDPPIIVEVGKGACRLKFDASIVQRMFQASISYNTEKNGKTVIDSLDERNFGLTYTFTLVEGSNHAAGVGEAVDLPEWLSPIPLLSALAAEFGLKVETVENFHEFFSKRSDASSHPFAHSAIYNMHVLARDGSISEDEWEISRLYMAIKFTKIRDIEVSDDDEKDGSDDDEKEGSEENISPPTPTDPLKAIKALSKAKGLYGNDEWEKLSSQEKTAAVKNILENNNES